MSIAGAVVDKLPVSLVRFLFSLWPPFWFTGISLTRLSKDWRYARVEMPLRFYNKNILGIHFGGSLYSMVDPWYMMLISKNIGKSYYVVDYSATIQYQAPGRGRVYAEFFLSDTDINEIKQLASTNEKVIKTFTVLIKNTQQEIISEVKKKIYIRKRTSLTT